MRAFVRHIEGVGSPLELRSPAPEGEVPALGGVVPWPFSPSKAIEIWVSSPPLGAVSGLISRAISGARIGFYYAQEGSEEQAGRFQEAVFFYAGVKVMFAEWVALAVQSLEAVGNAFVEVADGMLNLLPPQYCRLVQDWAQGEMRLVYAPPGGSELVLPPWGGGVVERGYLHAAHRTVFSHAYGLPPWIWAIESVALDAAHRRYLYSFMSNSASPRHIVLVGVEQEASVREEEARELANTIASFFQVDPSNINGKNMVVAYPAGVKVEFKPIGATSDDPTYLALSNTALREILMVRGVSMLHLGITEGGYRATASEQARGLVEYVINPVARLIANLVGEALWPGGEVSIEFAIDDRDTTVAMVDAAVRAAGVPVLTPDEARELLGYEPVGDDQLWRPASMMPMGAEEEGD